ncbi:hypothetical protein [Jiangella asiatica]|uniref:Uncharacterized protein n=1 Tax=Jiangella asiatica TaxID=2530372 RepID=A0A4R5CQL0_9ACTN|nr:hypothetical protein [Jiangella asiatica]TDE02799.1 hypothetical protein E1269_21115 [Jiangella asiatica]
MVADERVERCGHLQGRGVEPGQHLTAVGDGDLVGAHAADGGQRLGEQQHEQPADAGVEADRVVVQEQVDVGPSFLLGHGDLRQGLRSRRGRQAGVDAAAAQPGDEAVQGGAGSAGLAGEVAVEVGLRRLVDRDCLFGGPGQEPDRGEDPVAGVHDLGVGELGPFGGEAQFADHLPAGEPADEVGVLGRQLGKVLVQPREHPLDPGVIRRQHADRG